MPKQRSAERLRSFVEEVERRIENKLPHILDHADPDTVQVFLRDIKVVLGDVTIH